MLRQTREAMIKHAQTLEPSSERAQCYTISDYIVQHSTDKTIASCFTDDHCDLSHAKRHAHLCVEAGCAKKQNGFIIFEDGSKL